MNSQIIYALTVGSGLLGLSELPGRTGRMDEDLLHIGEWRPSLVMSLTSLAEMAQHEAQGLGGEIQSRGARWIHLPVPDMGVPDPTEAGQWSAALDLASAALQGGGRVLVHCMGGCGRSGMVVLRLMIMAGEKPEPALARLRRVRPCAVETEEQLRWASRA